MKILLYTRPIIPPWDEGSKNLAYGIAREYSGSAELHLLTTKTGQWQADNRHQQNVVSEPIFSSPKLGVKEKYELLRRLYRFNLSADIIHFLFTPRSLTSSLIRARLKFSSVKTIQTIATIDDKILSNPSLAKNIFFADILVAQSRWTKDRLTQSGFPNVQLAYPGIDLDKFRPAGKDQEMMKKYGLSTNDRVVLFPGEFTRQKGIDDILEAFRTIIRQGEKNFKLLIACRIKSTQDEMKRQAIIDDLQRQGFSDQIKVLNFVEDMPKLYNLADMVIFTVREMAGKFDIPLAVIEPMACCKPVIVSDIPVLKEFIRPGITGSVTPIGDIQQISRAIIQLGKDPSVLKTIGDNARKFATMTFNIRSCAKKYEQIYSSLDPNR